LLYFAVKMFSITGKNRPIALRTLMLLLDEHRGDLGKTTADIRLSYALPNSLAVGCLYHRLHKGVCGEDNIGPLIHRDGAARTP
jgi:hypothetical protein